MLVSGRELADTQDVFRCLRADTGAEVWAVRYAAPGGLDFGNSTRATPVVHGDLAILYGAFGHLNVVELASGKVLWHKDLKTEFQSAGRMAWGLCSSPLVVDDKLIVNPGGPEASLVAFGLRTGDLIWKSPGGAAGHGSLMLGEFGGVRQIVGHDESSLGGWDPATGRRLWTVEPPKKNDYNVPTPMAYRGDLIVATENNGTRRFRFKPGGLIDPAPVAVFADLNPETTSPVIVGDRLFGGSNRMIYCLDLRDGLKLLWKAADDAVDQHASFLASDDRLLIADMSTELILLDVRADAYKPLSRVQALPDESGLYAHPALANRNLYIRGADAVFCVSLAP